MFGLPRKTVKKKIEKLKKQKVDNRLKYVSKKAELDNKIRDLRAQCPHKLKATTSGEFITVSCEVCETVFERNLSKEEWEWNAEEILNKHSLVLGKF